jgi:hypothetical protein
MKQNTVLGLTSFMTTYTYVVSSVTGLKYFLYIMYIKHIILNKPKYGVFIHIIQTEVNSIHHLFKYIQGVYKLLMDQESELTRCSLCNPRNLSWTYYVHGK